MESKQAKQLEDELKIHLKEHSSANERNWGKKLSGQTHLWVAVTGLVYKYSGNCYLDSKSKKLMGKE